MNVLVQINPGNTEEASNDVTLVITGTAAGPTTMVNANHPKAMRDKLQRRDRTDPAQVPMQNRVETVQPTWKRGHPTPPPRRHTATPLRDRLQTRKVVTIEQAERVGDFNPDDTNLRTRSSALPPLPLREGV